MTPTNSQTTTETQPRRYVVTVSFYQLSDNDYAAVNDATKFTMQLNKQNDCQATIEQIHESTFGKIGTRKVM